VLSPFTVNESYNSKEPDPELEVMDPELEVMDPELEVMDPDPELDLNLTKNHQNNSNLIIMTLKIH
jgi:hypothetical protein